MYLYERTLLYIYRSLFAASGFFRELYYRTHRKRRFQERYSKKYTKEVENQVLSMIRGKKSGGYYVGKSRSGATIFKLKIREYLVVYPVYEKNTGRIKTYLTKEMAYNSVEK